MDKWAEPNLSTFIQLLPTCTGTPISDVTRKWQSAGFSGVYIEWADFEPQSSSIYLPAEPPDGWPLLLPLARLLPLFRLPRAGSVVLSFVTFAVLNLVQLI